MCATNSVYHLVANAGRRRAAVPQEPSLHCAVRTGGRSNGAEAAVPHALVCPTCALKNPSRRCHSIAGSVDLLEICAPALVVPSKTMLCKCCVRLSSHGWRHVQGRAHPQAAITSFVKGASKRDTYQKLLRTPAQQLPAASGVVLVTHEDEAGAHVFNHHRCHEGSRRRLQTAQSATWSKGLYVNLRKGCCATGTQGRAAAGYDAVHAASLA